MRFLLMSQALENDSIKTALTDLLGKSPEESAVTIVTTASNASSGDKRWLLRMLNQFDGMGFKTLDILDFAGLPEDVWLPRFESADVLMFTGGNTTHLMYEMNQVGMKGHLDELLKTRVYAGNSAGSIVTGKNLAMANTMDKQYSTQRNVSNLFGSLEYNNFHIRPHWNHPSHPQSTEEMVEAKIAKYDITEPVYLIDDKTAIKVDGDNIEVVSEGNWKVYNQT